MFTGIQNGVGFLCHTLNNLVLLHSWYCLESQSHCTGIVERLSVVNISDISTLFKGYGSFAKVTDKEMLFLLETWLNRNICMLLYFSKVFKSSTL